MSEKTYKIIKNTVLIVLAVLTTCAIIFGCLWKFGRNFGIKINNPFNDSNLGEDIIIDREFDENITAIKLNVDLGDVSICQGDAFSIDANMPEKLMPDIYVEDEVLVIENHQEVSLSNGISLEDDYYIDITVPEGAKLSCVNINLNLGEIALADINSNEITLVLACGSVTIDNIVGQKLSSTVNLGDFVIENSSVNELISSVDCGDNEAKNLEASFVEANSNLGDIEFSAVSFEHGTFIGDVGDIQVDGDFASINAELSLGDIEITPKKADVKIEATTDVGNVVIND